MRTRTILAATVATLVAGVALAQGAPPPPNEAGKPPPPPPGRDMGRPPEGGPPQGFRHGGPGGPGGPPMHGMPFAAKGTMVRVDRDGGVTIKCAEEEPTKACMEAVAPVIDKLRITR